MTTALAEPTRVGEAAGCAHCGLPVPLAEVEPAATTQYCCGGCRTAWLLIHEIGLESYYRSDERRGQPVRSSGKDFAEFDHPAFERLYMRRSADGLAEVELYLDGVHCASCVWLVERVPLAVPGAVSAELNVARSLARIRWDPAATRLSAIAQFLDRLGYRPHPFRTGKAEALRRAETRKSLARIGIAGALAVNVMTVSLALYAGWFGSMEPEYVRYFRWISLGLTIPAIVSGPLAEMELLLEGRLQRQAPEIDGRLLINDGTAPAGSLVEVEITDAHPYDVVGGIFRIIRPGSIAPTLRVLG